MSRPSSYTQEVGDAICVRIAEGESLRSICEDEKMPAKSTVLLWCLKLPEFSDQYTRAREIQAEVQADEIVDIADDARNDWKRGRDDELIPDSEAIQRSKLRIEARKWNAAKLLPKKYGEKQTVKHEFDELTDEQLIERAKVLFGGTGTPGPAEPSG